MAENLLKEEEIRIVEALLFSSSDVLTQAKVNRCFDHNSPSLENVVCALKGEYDREKRSFTIEKVAGGYRLVTRPEYHPWIKRLHSRAKRTSLSSAALETLAVVAYKGPVSRLDIETIRGVNCGSVLKALLEKRLIKIKGRAPGPGRPLLYTVTNSFLVAFGIDKLSDLPKLRELSDLVEESNPTGHADLSARQGQNAAG